MHWGFNARGAWAIFSTEVERAFRTAFQSIFAPVLTTSLYFVVFGAAIGSRMNSVGGTSYGAFIIPGLLLLTLLGETTSNASFGIHMPRFSGTIYELLSAPVGVAETLLGLVGAAVAKSLILTAIILVTARFFVAYEIAHPVLALGYVLLVCTAFALFGFVIGVWADGWDKLRIVPALILTPLTFLGGTFYSIDMLPDPWRSVALMNPIVYLVNGLRWTFSGHSDVNIWISFGLTLAFLIGCIAVVSWMFRTGWRLRA